MYGYLYRDRKKGKHTSELNNKECFSLIYNGNNLSDVVDVQETVRSRDIYSKAKTFIIEIKVYGKNRFIELPTLDEYDEAQPSKQFYDKLLELTRDGLITDESRGVRQEVVKFVHMILKGANIFFIPIKTEIVQNDGNRFERFYKDPKDIGAVVLAKEQMLGFTNPNKVKVKGYDKEMDLSTNYELPDPRNHENLLHYINNFSWGIRDALFSNVLEDWNANPQHYNHRRTTLLQARQIDLIKRMGWRTVFICPRQMGKSMFLALMVILELLSYNYYQSSKARQIIYLSYSVNAFEFVSGYIQKLMANIPRLNDSIVCRDNTIRYVDNNKKTISECRFFTSLGRAPATGYSGDTIIIDEAMLISEKIRRGIEPIARGNGSKVLIATAYYPEIYQDKMTYDRPIKLCLEREKESREILDIDNHILSEYDARFNGEPFKITHAGLRYTVDDSEVTIDKEGWKASLEDNQEEYMKQLYSVAPEKHQLFTYRDKMINVHNSGYDSIVIAYDPAKTKDISAVLVTGLSKFRGAIEYCDEYQLNKTDKSSYFPQAEQLKNIIKKRQGRAHNGRLYLVMDNSHDGVMDAMESTGLRFFKSYRWTGGTEPRQGSRDNQINLPKYLMVEASLFLFDNGVIKIFESCKQLQQQLDHYFQFENKYTKQNKYQGEGEHDDFVSAMLMANYTRYDTFGLKYAIEDLKNSKGMGKLPNGLDEDDVAIKKSQNRYGNIEDYLYNSSDEKQNLYSERY